MRKFTQRLAVSCLAGVATIALTIAPAAAANVPINVSWVQAQTGMTITPSSATINSGDTLSIAFSSADTGAQLLYWSSSDCSGTPIGTLGPGQIDNVTPSASTTYTLRAQDLAAAVGSACQAVPVTVTGTGPPPAVPEAPFAAAVLVLAGGLFGAGFFVLRRRAARAVV